MNTAQKNNLSRGQYEENVSLARYTSWKVGGEADILFRPVDLLDLKNFLATLDDAMPVTWLGRGTNVLIRDGGLRGAVILLHGCLDKLEQMQANIIRAEVAVPCAKLARFSANKGLLGAEFLAGIPGSVGGALAMNSGAYGGETWQFVKSVETLDRTGTVRTRTEQDMQVGYRSVQGLNDEWFIAAQFEFTSGDGGVSREKIRKLLSKRNAAQPVGHQSCGSVFRNPENDYAARLIDACKLKGIKVGGAQVSTKHANFIINTGDATAKDIEDLIVKVRTTVEAEFGIALIAEVKIIGEPQ